MAVALKSPEQHIAENPFLDDMVDFFSGLREGHIGFRGYEGKGGELYAKWLATNDKYRSQVTLKELELISEFVPALAELCGRTKNFVLLGAPGSLAVFLQKTYFLLDRIAVRRNAPPHFFIADISAGAFAKAKTEIEGYDRRFVPQFIEGNFFAPLPLQPKDTAIYVPGITLTNPPFDLINNSTENVLRATLSNFSHALSRGGVLLFTFANDDGIDADGKILKEFYDHPLIHAYQGTIFDRVVSELKPTGNFDPEAFRIHHEWRADRHALTRHATITHPINFRLGGHKFDLRPETFGRYMANNVRPPDRMVERLAKEAGFSEAYIFGLQGSNLRFAALVI